MISDDILIQRIAMHRDQAAFSELYRRHETAAYRLALYITGDSNRAEEAVQDGMFSVWNNSAQFQPSNARGWLMSIVAQKSICLKRKVPLHEVSIDMATQSEKIEVHSDAHESLERREMILSLRNELSQLPEQERQLVGLYYVGGLTQDQISEVLHLPQRTVSFRLREILDSLRAVLLAKGFASVVPLSGGILNADLLNKAICTGVRPPHGLANAVLSKTFSSAHASVRVATATTAKGGATFLWLTGVSMMFVLASVVTWAMYQRSNAVPTPTTPTNGVITVIPVVLPEEPALNATWDFSKNSDAAKDLKAVVGTWEWKNDIGKESGAMILTTKVLVVKLPTKVSKQPFVLYLTGRLQKGDACYGAAWCADNFHPGFQYWVDKKVTHQPNNFKVKAIFKNDYVMLLNKGYASVVRKFERVHSLDHICIELSNVIIEKIVLRDLLSSDDLDDNCDPERLIEKLMRTPEHVEVGHQERYEFSTHNVFETQKDGAEK